MPSTGNNSSSSNTVQLLSTQHGWKSYLVRGQVFEVEDMYTVTSVAGYGAYGIVCGAFDNLNLREVAIKRVGHVFEDLIDGRRIWRELVIHRLLNESGCRNILNIIRVVPPRDGIADFRDLYIVTDLYDTDLHTAIHRTKGVSINSLKCLMTRVLRSVADFHSMGIIHRDLKPSNILCDQAHCEGAVICDFGLARAGVLDLNEPLDLTDYVVTRWYRPPELLFMCSYSFPVDLWAIGCIIAEYVLQKPLFGGRDYIHQMQLVFASISVTGTGFIEESSASALNFMKEIVRKYRDTRPLSQVLSVLPPDGIDLVTKLLAFEPQNRLTAREALQHPFFSGLGGEDTDSYPAPPLLDLSFDLHAEISEAQLRRAIWSEVEYYQHQESQEKQRNHRIHGAVWLMTDALVANLVIFR